MIDLRKIQEEHKAWQDRNFTNAEPWECVVGAQEELGELCHTFLKAHQGIRGKHRVLPDADNQTVFSVEAKDAIGDIIIFLMGLCSMYGWDLENILEITWSEVSQRKWR